MKPVAVVSQDLLQLLIPDLRIQFNDSKQPKKQEKLRPLSQQAITLCDLEPLEIDSINILNASIKAMQECVLKLTPTRIYQWMETALIRKKGIKQ
jgi:ribonuclease HII